MAKYVYKKAAARVSHEDRTFEVISKLLREFLISPSIFLSKIGNILFFT
jgi:hypothetical protein